MLHLCILRVLWCSVCFCTGRFVMVPLNLTCPHCLPPFVFENIFHLFANVPLKWVWPNSTRMVSGWSPTKIVQMVLIGCISMSWCQTLGFPNAIFKKSFCLKAHSPELLYWCTTSSRGPLPIFGWQHKWSSVNGSAMTFDLFLRWAIRGPSVEIIYAQICNNVWWNKFLFNIVDISIDCSTCSYFSSFFPKTYEQH